MKYQNTNKQQPTFLILKTLIMKNKYTNFLKTGLFIALGLMAFVSQAQNTSTQITRQTETMATTATATNTSVKVVDNKGTIKYLQVENGLTSFTDLTNDRQTTTWQLGGTLTASNTYIDLNGNEFGFDGLDVISSTVSASTDAVSGTTHLTSTSTGWTLLVRDEANGNIFKMQATDLMQSGHTTDALTANATADHTITATGVAASHEQVWVYRNGVKLIAGSDYTVATDQVTIVYAAPGSSPGVPLYDEDVFEVQWVK